MKFALFAFFVICIIIISMTNAHAFYCGNNIVNRGDIAVEALTSCGNPFYSNYVIDKIDGKKKYVDQWFYNCGEKDFIYSVSIYNGTIIKIDTVKRGIGKGQCQ